VINGRPKKNQVCSHRIFLIGIGIFEIGILKFLKLEYEIMKLDVSKIFEFGAIDFNVLLIS
jgi:hypothetical protein